MSKKQETISDIVAEMRRLNPEKFLSTPWYCEQLPNKMRSYADRIEEAAKREREAGAEAAQICGEIGEIVGRATREESSQVGNAEAMREALLRCDAIAQMPEIREYLIVKDMRNIIKKALEEPSRNCDAFSKAQVLEMFEDRSFQKEDTIEWLFDEAKGESK